MRDEMRFMHRQRVGAWRIGENGTGRHNKNDDDEETATDHNKPTHPFSAVCALVILPLD